MPDGGERNAVPTAAQWRRAGRALLGAFEHISILNLPRSHERRERMRLTLSQKLGLREDADFGFASGADCNAYGKWTNLDAAMRTRSAAGGGSGSLWWLQRDCRSPTPLGPPHCLHPEMAHCSDLNSGFSCKYVCYTLSVASALHAFLQSGRNRTLLLEDDVCPTSALVDSVELLQHMAYNRKHDRKPDGGWAIVKLGGCGPCFTTQPPVSCPAPSYEPIYHQLSRHDPDGIQLKKTLGRTFCAHALAVTREGAEMLLRLSLPVSTTFDNMLMLLGGGFGPDALKHALSFAGVASESSLRAWHVDSPISLFAQAAMPLVRDANEGRHAQSNDTRSHHVRRLDDDKGLVPPTWKKWYRCFDEGAVPTSRRQRR